MLTVFRAFVLTLFYRVRVVNPRRYYGAANRPMTSAPTLTRTDNCTTNEEGMNMTTNDYEPRKKKVPILARWVMLLALLALPILAMLGANDGSGSGKSASAGSADKSRKRRRYTRAEMATMDAAYIATQQEESNMTTDRLKGKSRLIVSRGKLRLPAPNDTDNYNDDPMLGLGDILNEIAGEGIGICGHVGYSTDYLGHWGASGKNRKVTVRHNGENVRMSIAQVRHHDRMQNTYTTSFYSDRYGKDMTVRLPIPVDGMTQRGALRHYDSQMEQYRNDRGAYLDWMIVRRKTKSGRVVTTKKRVHKVRGKGAARNNAAVNGTGLRVTPERMPVLYPGAGWRHLSDHETGRKRQPAIRKWRVIPTPLTRYDDRRILVSSVDVKVARKPVIRWAETRGRSLIFHHHGSRLAVYDVDRAGIIAGFRTLGMAVPAGLLAKMGDTGLDIPKVGYLPVVDRDFVMQGSDPYAEDTVTFRTYRRLTDLEMVAVHRAEIERVVRAFTGNPSLTIPAVLGPVENLKWNGQPYAKDARKKKRISQKKARNSAPKKRADATTRPVVLSNEQIAMVEASMARRRARLADLLNSDGTIG